MTLQYEAAFTLLAPHAKRLRLSIKWQAGRSVARIIGAPKVKPLELCSWQWAYKIRPPGAKHARPGYVSWPLCEFQTTPSRLPENIGDAMELLDKLQKLAKP